MNGERCRDANLQFEPSMRRADKALAIAIIECTTIDCTIANFGRTKPKWSMFSKAASEARLCRLGIGDIGGVANEIFLN
jgi:hypothetical protein